jgi:hypothetical protein
VTFLYYREHYEQCISKHRGLPINIYIDIDIDRSLLDNWCFPLTKEWKLSKTSQKKMKIIMSICRTLLAACSLFILPTIKFKEKWITAYKPIIFFIVVLHPGKCDLSWLRDVITVRDSLTRFQFLLTSGNAKASLDSIANKLVYRSSCIELNLSSSDQLTYGNGKSWFPNKMA